MPVFILVRLAIYKNNSAQKFGVGGGLRKVGSRELPIFLLFFGETSQISELSLYGFEARNLARVYAETTNFQLRNRLDLAPNILGLSYETSKTATNS